MKKNDFDNRLQNDLFPDMPLSFERKLTRAMESEGVKVKKRPTAAGVFAGVVSVAAAAAVLLIVLVGVLSGGRSDSDRAAASLETPMPSPAFTMAPYAWDWTPRIFILSNGFEFENEEKFEALYTGILDYLKQLGESEPDELWLCAIKDRFVKGDTGKREDGYLSGYYVLAQHAFGENDGPELYCLSEDFEVLWATEGSVPGPNRAVNPEEDNYAGTYQAHFLYGMAPTAAHVTRGALVGSEPGTDIEFSMRTSLAEVRDILTDAGSRHANVAREYFLFTVSAGDWRGVMENPILRFETEEGNVDVNMKKDLPQATVALGDRFTADPVPTVDPSVTPLPVSDSETKVVDLTGRTCLTGEPDYGALILRALKVSGVKPPRELWLCAVDPFSENEGSTHSRALILAQYSFEGASGPELFYYEDGRILWMTEGYEPEGINVAVEEDLTILFGVSHAYDGRALAMTEGTVTIANDDPRSFGPVLPLEKVQKIVGEGPNYDYAREFYLCSLPNGGQVTGLSVKAEGRDFDLTMEATVWHPQTVPAMAVETDGVVYPGTVRVLDHMLDEDGRAYSGKPLSETLADGLLFKGKKVWTRPLTVLTASDSVSVDSVTVCGVASGGVDEQLQLDGADLDLSEIDALPAGEYYLCFHTTPLGSYSETSGRYAFVQAYTVYKVTLE